MGIREQSFQQNSELLEKQSDSSSCHFGPKPAKDNFETRKN